VDVAGRPFTVVGAGVSGIAAANALALRDAEVRLVEARSPAPRPPGLDPRVAYADGTNEVREGDVAVLSPGIPEVSPVRAAVAARAAEVIGEVELFWRLCPAPILAVTGTDGKSTTTTMLGAMARAHGLSTFVGGNLGNPLCEGLEELGPESLVVAEVSCFQLTTCHAFRPRVAVVTNIAEDHLDYHGSFAAYQAAKRRVWAAMTEEDTLVLNADDPWIAAWTRPARPRVATFSLTRPDADAFFDGASLHLREGAEVVALMPRSALPLLGAHNVANALAAALAARRWGLPIAAIRAALEGYEPLPHRLVTVATHRGVRWVNDSKATNPNAAAAGVRAVDGPLIVLAGGSDKGADFGPLAGLLRDRARLVVLYGQTRGALAQAIGAGHPVIEVDELPQAVAAAAAAARPGDTVLLSPACASYDQFRSYAHRGDVFTDLVRALPAEEPSSTGPG